MIHEDIITTFGIIMVRHVFPSRLFRLLYFLNQTLRLCSIHNLVNTRLHKPQFDCAHLDEEYDCGCGDPPLAAKSGSKEKVRTSFMILYARGRKRKRRLI